MAADADKPDTAMPLERHSNADMQAATPHNSRKRSPPSHHGRAAKRPHVGLSLMELVEDVTAFSASLGAGSDAAARRSDRRRAHYDGQPTRGAAQAP